jgi:hypothetical protein
MLRQLARAADSMVQGGLAATTRTCGKPACPCHSDPARRHGPHLYFTWRADGKPKALYVPPQHAAQAKAAQQAWARFWEIGVQLSDRNRAQLRRRWRSLSQPTTALPARARRRSE